MTESETTEEILPETNAIETLQSNLVTNPSRFTFSRILIVKILLSAVILITAFRSHFIQKILLRQKLKVFNMKYFRRSRDSSGSSELTQQG